MNCINCGRPIQFDKKKRTLHVDPIEYGKVMSVLFCYGSGLIVARKEY